MSRLFRKIPMLCWSFPYRPAGGNLGPSFSFFSSAFSFQSNPKFQSKLRCCCTTEKDCFLLITLWGLTFHLIYQSLVNPPFPLTMLMFKSGIFFSFLFIPGCNMRCHLIVDAPYAVIVLAHRFSLRFCMDLLHSTPNVWGRVFRFFFFRTIFLITRTFEPVVINFGCNSTWYLGYTPVNLFIFRLYAKTGGGGSKGPLRHMAFTQVSHQPQVLIWLTSQCQREH